MAHEASDAELVARYRAGEAEAFADLVMRYTSPLFNLIHRLVSDRAEAENLTQETFLRAWNALPRISLDQPLKPYLMRIAVNLCSDWSEKNRAVWLEPFEADNERSAPASDADEMLDGLGDAELAGRVRAAVEELPPAYRVVITLRYTEELSYEEIAMALDLPLNTVRTHLRRAKSQLGELLADDLKVVAWRANS